MMLEGNIISGYYFKVEGGGFEGHLVGPYPSIGRAEEEARKCSNYANTFAVVYIDIKTISMGKL